MPDGDPQAAVAGQTVLVADDHDVVREGMRMRLESMGFKVIAEAADGEQSLRLLREHRPDLALIDYQMPHKNGFEVAAAVKEESLPTRTIIFSALTDRVLVERAFAAGADGFVAKDSPREIVMRAIEAVSEGAKFIDPRLAAGLISPNEAELSARELEILELMGEGMSNKVIADKLNIGVETVKTHVGSIMRKLEAGSRTEAVVIAFRRSLLA